MSKDSTHLYRQKTALVQVGRIWHDRMFPVQITQFGQLEG